MSDSDWYETSNGVSIRQIGEGDAVSCALTTKQRVKPCDPPVAVVKGRTTQSVCSRHLADRMLFQSNLRKKFAPGIGTVAMLEALEQIKQLHADEMAELTAANIRRYEAEAFEGIPDSVRAQFGLTS